MIHFREAESLIVRHYVDFDFRYYFDGQFEITMADWPVGEIGSVDRIKAKQIAKPPQYCYLFNFPFFDGGIGMFLLNLRRTEIWIERLEDDMDDVQFEEMLKTRVVE